MRRPDEQPFPLNSVKRMSGNSAPICPRLQTPPLGGRKYQTFAFWNANFWLFATWSVFFFIFNSLTTEIPLLRRLNVKRHFVLKQTGHVTPKVTSGTFLLCSSVSARLGKPRRDSVQTCLTVLSKFTRCRQQFYVTIFAFCATPAAMEHAACVGG